MESLAHPGIREHSNHYYKTLNRLTAITFFAFLLVSCGNSLQNNDSPGGSQFSEIQIGSQVWMAKNFDGVLFRNGDSIPHAKTPAEWQNAGRDGKPAWCDYQNDSAFGRKYGRIYNWYAVNDPRGFGVAGWHVPTNGEWIILEDFLGPAEAGLKLKCKADVAKNGIDNNSIQFCVKIGGYRGKEGGFSGLDEFTYLFSSTEHDKKMNDI